ncbi:MAG: VOC family protein [Planctomycetaceae bacterium]|jgi:catechol 2,3-dioxygenase-like lactoylglutathione lyase family enzyme|nr:VOC family protein [Planctomycetaceae bacterium]
MFKNKIHHIGIIVPNEEQVNFLLKLTGLEHGHSVYVKEYQATCVFAVEKEREGSQLEFIIPDVNSKLSKFNNGLGGIHHLAIETPNIKQTMEYLDKEFEIDFIEKEPVEAGDLLINFLSPSMTRSIIIEFVQKK